MTLKQRVKVLEKEIATLKSQLKEQANANSCVYNQITANLTQIALNYAERKA